MELVIVEMINVALQYTYTMPTVKNYVELNLVHVDKLPSIYLKQSNSGALQSTNTPGIILCQHQSEMMCSDSS